MPIYDYACKDCNHSEEIVSTKILTETDVVNCTKCGSENFKRVWNLGFVPEIGQEAFSFGMRSWRKGLTISQQAEKLLGGYNREQV